MQSQTEEEEIADTRDFVAYSCWTEEDLLARQNKTAAKVGEALALPIPLAAVLLRYFEWNVDKLYAQYLLNPEKVLQAAGVTQAQAQGGVSAAKLSGVVETCLICDEPSTAVKVETFLPCQHQIVTYRLHYYSITLPLLLTVGSSVRLD